MEQNQEVQIQNTQNSIPTYTYAGFWWRFLAYLIDGVIVYFITFIPATIIFSLLSVLSAYTNRSTLFNIIFVLLTIAVSIVSIIIVIIYNSWFESSKYQGTPGKKLLNIIVTDESGNKLSFKRALLRNVSKLLSGLIFDIGYIMAAFTEKNQALHDIIAKTLVLKKV